MKYKPTIFPTLQGTTWEEVDLGSLAVADFPSHQNGNKLLNAEFCDQWVKQIADKVGADFTWGGHFEDRKHLWTGYYDNTEKVTHLGIDYNVPSGTPVAAPAACEVVHSWADTSIHNGWGGRLILKMDDPWQNAPYLVLGHLAHKDLPKEGTRFEKGDIITVTGKPHENGGWFPHLHVQCVNEDFYQKHIDDLKLLDGYYLEEGKPYALAPSAKYLVGFDD
jgi:murein DD-endopeptidase MepM/ murein hydrolase activator NlpD